MPYDPKLHHRRSVRLPDFDYANAATYYITLCSRHRELIFGHVTNGEMIENNLGRLVHQEWLRTEEIRKNVTLGAFVVMPNHFHALVTILEPDRREEGGCNTPLRDLPRQFRTTGQDLGAIVRGFKGASTRLATEALRQSNLQVWQRSYYETVVKNETQFEAASNYIRENPARWDGDIHNPDNVGKENAREVG